MASKKEIAGTIKQLREASDEHAKKSEDDFEFCQKLHANMLKELFRLKQRLDEWDEPGTAALGA